MSLRRSRQPASEKYKQYRRQRQRKRRLKLESLEERRLLAGPELVGISADGGQPLANGQILNSAPRELTLDFVDDLPISPATLGAIQVTRSFNDVFGDADDSSVSPGAVTIGGSDTSVVVRFETPLQDANYRVLIQGSGNTPLANTDGEPFNGGADLTQDFQLDLGPQVLAVVPQPLGRDGTGALTQATNQIVVHVNDDTLSPVFAESNTFYRLHNEDDGSLLVPSQVSYDQVADQVTLTFEADLPVGNYKLEVGDSAESNDVIADATLIGSMFPGYSTNGFLGDTESGSRDVDIFRVDADGAGAFSATVTPSGVLDTGLRLFDASGAQVAGANSGAAGEADTLDFAVPAAGTYYLGVSSLANSTYDPLTGTGVADGETGVYQLDTTFDLNLIIDDDNSTYDTATDVGVLGAAGRVVTETISASPVDFPLPGGDDEPGHRQIPRESHLGGAAPTPSGPLQVAFYNFRTIYQTNPVPLVNTITDNQKQRAREIFEIYGDLLGVQFVESETLGLTVVTGDLRAIDPSVATGPGGVTGISNGSLNGMVIMDAAENWGDSEYGGAWFRTAMHEVGHSLGVGHTFDLPGLTIMGDRTGARFPDPGEPVYPGDHDIVHIQRLHPPRSNDLDLYRFEVVEAGYVEIETIAERMEPSASLLNTQLTVYGAGSNAREFLASNDDYYGDDSYLKLHLEPGEYFVGVSSSGTEDIDPAVADSGFGGISEGPYELALSFQPDARSQLLDSTGVALDGDSDGTPGGNFSFWFQSGHTIFVDKANDTTDGPDGDGTLANPFDSIATAVQTAADRVILPGGGGAEIADGDTFTLFDGVNPRVTFEFDSAGGVDAESVAIPFLPADTAETLATNIALAINGVAELAVSATATDGLIDLTGSEQTDLSGTPSFLFVPKIIRVAGNGGTDGDATTVADNAPYLVGIGELDQPLSDGQQIDVPQGTTLMVDSGVILKMQRANLDAGTTSLGIDHRNSAIQILGVPGLPVYFRHFRDDSVGGDSDGPSEGPEAGGWGGIVFRSDSDLEELGIFLNHVGYADMNHGGGQVFVDGEETSFTPIHLIDARPTIMRNTISNSADAALSSGTLSFDDSMGRIGPDIHNNLLVGNSVNGLFIRINTEFGESLDRLVGNARWDDIDVPHVLTENLLIAGDPGGPILGSSGELVARAAGRLRIDPGVVVKLDGSRIEAEIGAQLIAEGTPDRKIIFTSIQDDEFGGSGTFDTTSDGDAVPPEAGQWGGLFFNIGSRGSLDHTVIAHGGGLTPIEGDFDGFSAVEIHQAEVRLTHSEIRNNSAVGGRSDRNGRGTSERSTIFVRGAQPVIVNNVMRDNTGDLLNINANALQFQISADPGRTTGLSDRYREFDDNHGPLIRLNRMSNNELNGMTVRAATLTTKTVWDDVDIVHVVEDEFIVPDHHTYSGLVFQSSSTASLVVKLDGNDAGFTATGNPLDIDDRIGGTIQVLGTGSHPVVFTSLADDTITAGLDTSGQPLGDTNNNGSDDIPLPGDWRSIRLDRYSNDSNVRFLNEEEPILAGQQDVNGTPAQAQVLGVLAPDLRSGDDNRSLGFKVSGFISLDSPSDADVYSFAGTAGSEIWLDIDLTNPSLDAMLELIDASGQVLARSTANDTLSGIAEPLIKDDFRGPDFYTVNPRDPGMRLTLPGTPGQVNNYFVRVRSESADLENVAGGESRGEYELQVRLRQVDEFPGSTIRFANIQYATNGIELLGIPSHSPLTGDSVEVANGITDLGNLLQSDRGALNVAGSLSSDDNVDFYRFSIDFDLVQAIAGFNGGGGSLATVFDIDYADGISRPDTTLALFDEATGELLLVSRDSNVDDDQAIGGPGDIIDDTSRGSFGQLDPFLGSVQLPTGVVPTGQSRGYLLAVMSNAQLPVALDGTFNLTGNPLVRLEPVTSIQRIAEDHIGFQGYTTGVQGLQTTRIEPTTQLFDVTSEIALTANVTPLTLSDMVAYVSTGGFLRSVNPFTGDRTADIGRLSVGGIRGQATQDISMRSDGVLYSVESLPMPMNGTAGALAVVDPETGFQGNRQNDAIPDFNAGPPPMGVDSNQSDALAWRRAGFDTGMNQVVYDLYYSVNDFASGESILYQADPDNGSAAIVQGMPWGPRGPISGVGLTTGLAFAGGNGTSEQMYGVSNTGLFYRILEFTGVPFHPETNAPFQGKAIPGAEDGFAGLAPGPKNLQGGAFKDMLFAITTTGRLFALDRMGEPQPVFEGGATFVETGIFGATGFTFSALDFNLWHPTMRRRGDDGHGINAAFDRSRSNPDTAQVNIQGYQSNEGEGGASFYFGLEPWVETDSQNEYFRYGQNAQFGATEAAHRDLTTNANILGTLGGNNYNLPGGAQGSLQTNAVDLSTYTAGDKPTLYFNYFLDTEDANFVGTGVGCCMRDSARVFGSPDGGTSWFLLATNNSILSNQPTAELPSFISASSTVSPNSQQRVQELFDNTGGWRQARVDLSEFAGSSDFIVRFDFSTAGSMNQNLEGDANGSFFEIERHLNNDFEGFYVDDVIIGLTERGEMVTNPPTDTTQTFAVPENTDPGGASEILVGPYQLEIRRGTPTATTITGEADDIIILAPLDSNERLIEEDARIGDRNLSRDQGHIQVESNRVENVSEVGILFDAGARDPAGNRPSPPPVQNLPTLNNERLVPAATIENNLIVNAAGGGIQFRGDPNTGNVAVAAVPFGRILNNTIYDASIGIEVSRNASPTVLNNIIVNASTGISVDASSLSTVIGGNLFAGNAEDGVLGESAIQQSIAEPLFIDPASGNFYLAPGSRAIDSSINSLVARPSQVAVGDPLGIPPSPIVAPDRDFFGQLRVDDPSQVPPPGLGSNIFKDRGAVERADFIGPSGRVISPLDQGATDLDPTASTVRVDDPIISEILVQVVDEGLGVDNTSITRDQVTLSMDGTVLVEGVDYDFGLDPTNSTIRLTNLPNNGTFREVYEIVLDNSPDTGIRDLADNVLRPNRPGGVTTFTVITAGLNKPPTVFDDDITTIENLPVNIPVLANDEGPDSPVVADTVTIVSPPASGQAVANADGTVDYTPAAGFTGTDSFTYTVEDLDGDLSNEATVVVTVITDVNDSPMLDNSQPMTLSNINEDDVSSQGNTVAEIIGSVPGDAITDQDIGAVEGIAIIAAETLNGAWEYNIGGGWITLGAVSETSATLLDTSARLRFSPSQDFAGPSGDIAFRAWDQSAGANGDTGVDTSSNGGATAFSVNSTTASLNVIPINDPPNPQDDNDNDPGGLTTNEDTPFTFEDTLLLANDTDDTPGTTLEVVSINQDATLGAVQLRVSILGTSITYLPNGAFESLKPGEIGTDTFTYTVRESAGLTGTATVEITVTGVNDAPTAVADTYATDEDSVLSVSAAGLLSNDTDVEGDTLSVVTASLTSQLGATVTLNDDGSFEYDPRSSSVLQALAQGETRDDTFSYTATDGLEQATGNVTITVTGQNDAPVAVDDAYTTAEDTTLEVPTVDGVLANDFDPEGGVVTATISQGPANGTVSLGTDGAFSYTPNENFVGTDVFTYIASDGTDSTTATVEIEVTNVNDPPEPSDDLYEVEQDSTLDVSAANGVLANDTDPDGDGLTAERLSGPSSGSLTLNSDGSFTYIPTGGFFGRDVFIYRAIDPLGQSATATVTIDVSNTRPLRNPSNPLDVNGDGIIAPSDVLAVVNYLNDQGPGPVPMPAPPAPPFLDVNGDNLISSADALAVINHINDEPDGEGEGATARTLPTGTPPLNADSESDEERRSDDGTIELIDDAFANDLIRGPVVSGSGYAQGTRKESEVDPLDDELLDELAADASGDDFDTLFGRLA